MDVEKEVKEILSLNLGMPITAIELTHRLQSDLGVDSLMAVELVLSVEERFAMDIPDTDVYGVAAFYQGSEDPTVQQVIDYIEHRRRDEPTVKIELPKTH